MIFVLIMFSILTVLMVAFTIQNYRKYGTLVVPVVVTGLCLIGVVWCGLKLPDTIQQIKSRHQTAKKVGRLSVSQRERLQKIFQKTGGSQTVEIPSISAEAQQDTLSLQEVKFARVLDGAYHKIGDVSFNEQTKAFQLRLYPDSPLANNVAVLETNPNQVEKRSWQDFTNALQKASQSISEKFKAGYTFELMGVKHTDQVLYAAKDGQELINVKQ